MKTRIFAIGIAALLSCGAFATLAADGGESASLRKLEASQGDLAVAIGAHRRGDFERAARAYQAAIAKDSEFVEALINLARIRADQGRLGDAGKLLDRATRLRPNYYAIPKTRGLVALRNKDAGLAVQEFTRALDLEPFDAESLGNLGAALILEGRAEEATRPLRDALRIDPHRATAVFNLGLARDLAADPARAAFYYRRFLTLVGPHDPARSQIEERLAELNGAIVPSVSSGVDEPDELDEPFEPFLPSTSVETQETNHEVE